MLNNYCYLTCPWEYSKWRTYRCKARFSAVFAGPTASLSLLRPICGVLRLGTCPFFPSAFCAQAATVYHCRRTICEQRLSSMHSSSNLLVGMKLFAASIRMLFCLFAGKLSRLTSAHVMRLSCMNHIRENWSPDVLNAPANFRLRWTFDWFIAKS